ncbi:MAG: glycosyltransferase family 2 protein [Methylobacterium mesophilicum]|nr:glycosyltransferase family 2 protein [Methylobacterium mesophilicum]
MLRNRRFRRRSRRHPPVTLTAVRQAERALGEAAIVLICVTKNARAYLPSFLAHYRAMGIARFAFVDDRSDDGTRETLAAQADVDLYVSPQSFRDSAGGLLWRDELVRRYGRDRWYVSVDSDEYLVFPGSEVRPLSSFIADIEHAGLTRALAVMLDLYPDGSEVRAEIEPDAFPTALSPYFDGASYRVANEKFCTAVRGGPRQRVFGADMRLTKFPVIFADAAMSFTGAGHHGPLPIQRNFSAVQAVLLHHKFPPGWQTEFRRIAERGSHFGGSGFYKDIVGHAAFGDAGSFRNAQSHRYAGSEDLIANGFMQDLRSS